MNLEFPTPGLTSLEASNHFLRALWTQLRSHFGKCAWQYMPYRDGKKQVVFVGHMDIGVATSIAVSLRYRTRSSIRELLFENVPDGRVASELVALVNSVLEKTNELKNFALATNIETFSRMVAPYEAPSLSIMPTSPTTARVGLVGYGFDDTEAMSDARSRLNCLLDLLAVATNSVYFVSDSGGADTVAVQTNVFAADPEWIDEYPVLDKLALLSEPFWRFVAHVVTCSNPQHQHLEISRACRHYHTARQQDALVTDQLKLISCDRLDTGEELKFPQNARNSDAHWLSACAEEVSLTLYMSALEVASGIGSADPVVCGTCNQPRYSIGTRVAEFVTKRLGGPKPLGGSSHVVRCFKTFYSHRSKYLHAGAVLRDRSYHGTSIPILDPGTDSGMHEYVKIPLLNVREWVGYMLRQHIQEVSVLELGK